MWPNWNFRLDFVKLGSKIFYLLLAEKLLFCFVERRTLSNFTFFKIIKLRKMLSWKNVSDVRLGKYLKPLEYLLIFCRYIPDLQRCNETNFVEDFDPFKLLNYSKTNKTKWVPITKYRYITKD